MNHTVMDLLTKIEAMRERTLVIRSMVERNQDFQHIQHSIDQVTDMARQVSNMKFDKNVKVGKK